MTDKTHEITPPQELMQEWVDNWYSAKVKHYELVAFVATQAARWGADQELEACCALALTDPCCGTKFQRSNLVKNIRNRRRPKPPSLKEQAVFAAAVLRSPDETCSITEIEQHWHTIRRALEQLPND